jgi:hypothetical protein
MAMALETTRWLRIAVAGPLLILVAMCTNCGGKLSPTAPTPPVTATPPAPTVTNVSIRPTGNFALTTIGETTQLTATATFSDNTTKDVTSDGEWRVADTRVVVVSKSGLLTVVGYGSTFINFIYGTRGAGNGVTVTPAGTFVISGRVREPGTGGLANVVVLDTLSRRTATTDAAGEFSLAELPSLHASLRVAHEGYEPIEFDATRPQVDLAIQQVVRLTAGETVKPHPLAPNDLSYTIDGERCDDCRLIRVVATRTGSLRVHVTWQQPATKLRLFVQGQIANGGIGDLTADTQIDAPHEVLMYLGAMPSTSASHTPFTFETSWH